MVSMLSLDGSTGIGLGHETVNSHGSSSYVNGPSVFTTTFKSIYPTPRLFHALCLWGSKGEQRSQKVNKANLNNKDWGKKHRRSQQVAPNTLPFDSLIICTN